MSPKILALIHPKRNDLTEFQQISDKSSETDMVKAEWNDAWTYQEGASARMQRPSYARHSAGGNSGHCWGDLDRIGDG
jgi:hypothetical protein